MDDLDPQTVVDVLGRPTEPGVASAAFNPLLFGPNAVKSVVQSLWDLPGRATKAAGDLQRQGDVYDPAPAVDAALTTMGGTAFSAPKGAMGAGPAIRTWHVSPHDFEKYDITKIGTGQGANSFGRGIYQAENPLVKNEYWDEFARRTPVDTPEHYAQTILQAHNFDRAAATQEAKRELDMMHPNAVNRRQYVQDTFDLLADPTAKIGPRVYETDIKADPAHFLDWDTPLAGQEAAQRFPSLLSSVAREAQDRAYAATSKVRQDELYNLVKNPENATGEMAYNGLIGQIRGGGRDAAKEYARTRMLEQGIPGIRYLDQGSRETASLQRQLADARMAHERTMGGPTTFPRAGGMWDRKIKELEPVVIDLPPLTRNYVVHDDQLLDIIRKYGLAPTAPVAGAAVTDQFQNQ